MKPVVVCLRRQGYTLVIYLDDMLIIAESYSVCQLYVIQLNFLLI